MMPTSEPYYANRQGKTFLGAPDVTTDGAGHADVHVRPPGPVPASQLTSPRRRPTRPAPPRRSRRGPCSSRPPPRRPGRDRLRLRPTRSRAGATDLHDHRHQRRPRRRLGTSSLVNDIPAGTTFVSFTAPAGWAASTPGRRRHGHRLRHGRRAVQRRPRRLSRWSFASIPAPPTARRSLTPPRSRPARRPITTRTTTPTPRRRPSPPTTQPPATADLEVTQSASPGTATVGQDDVTFTITVTNQGPASASNATLTETLPAGATFVSATGGVTPSDGKLTFPLGDLANGASLTFTVVVRPRSAGTLTASATASATEADPSTANNTATASASAVDPRSSRRRPRLRPRPSASTARTSSGSSASASTRCRPPWC